MRILSITLFFSIVIASCGLSYAADVTLRSSNISAQIKRVNEVNKMYHQVADSMITGMTAKGLWAAAQIESGGNPNSKNGKYAGLINIGEVEFKKYGPPYGDRMDPLHNLIAANRYAQDNAAMLMKDLGRQPTDAELYLSLQQGLNGTRDLLKNSHTLAVRVRGRDAIVGNVPDNLKKQAEKWTCAQFTSYWIGRFNEVMKKEEV